MDTDMCALSSSDGDIAHGRKMHDLLGTMKDEEERIHLVCYICRKAPPAMANAIMGFGPGECPPPAKKPRT